MPREFSFPFPLKLGLHARPASALQELASRFQSEIILMNNRNEKSADAKSTLALVAMDTVENDPCRLVVSGADEEQAFSELVSYLKNDFIHMDDGLPKIPEKQGQMTRLPRPLQKTQAIFFRGQPVSGGIAMAPAMVFQPFPVPEHFPISKNWRESEELEKVLQALSRLENDLLIEIDGIRNKTGQGILRAHLSILRDRDFRKRIIASIRQDRCVAGEAICKAAEFYARTLQNSRSLYLQERLIDIRDISWRLIEQIPGLLPAGKNAGLKGPAIVVADILNPSQFLAFKKKHLKGLVCSQGGATSHTAILARSAPVPFIIGIPLISSKISTGQELILDGFRGILIIEPDVPTRRFYQLELDKIKIRDEQQEATKGRPAQTADQKRLECGANIGSLDELKIALENGAEGVGLFRSEFMFLDRPEPPSEEEQYQIYLQAGRMSKKKPVIIRTIDIGGDKPIPYISLPREENPFLGFRAVRLYSEYETLIRGQLRAILRASVRGNLKIMIPLVTIPEEIQYVKKLLGKIKEELFKKGIAYNPGIELGIMVEVPAMAFSIDHLAKEVDFFSIGTNDLLQYFQAADRGNSRVSHLNQVLHPAFLRFLQQIVRDIHRNGKRVGMCGEMAGEKELLPLLIGLDIDEISMPSALIPEAKQAIGHLDSRACQQLLEKATSCSTITEVEQLLKTFFSDLYRADPVESDLIRLDSKSKTKEEAIKELVDMLDAAGRIEDCDAVEEAVWQREEVYSTAVGHGVAIPHGKSDAVRCNSMAFLKFSEPFFWHPQDNQPVTMAFLLAIREDDQGKEHLKIIARLSRLLMHEEFRDRLQAATDIQSVFQIISESLKDPV